MLLNTDQADIYMKQKSFHHFESITSKSQMIEWSVNYLRYVLVQGWVYKDEVNIRITTLDI